MKERKFKFILYIYLILGEIAIISIIMGFDYFTTQSRYKHLTEYGIYASKVEKVSDGTLHAYIDREKRELPSGKTIYDCLVYCEDKHAEKFVLIDGEDKYRLCRGYKSGYGYKLDRVEKNDERFYSTPEEKERRDKYWRENKYKDRLPFVGMKQEDIDKTIIGEPTKVYRIQNEWKKVVRYEYLWLYGNQLGIKDDYYNYESRAFVKVEMSSTTQTVTSVKTNKSNYYGQDSKIKDLLSDPEKKRPTYSGSGHSSNNYYTDPEDFYYDHYDDFDSYGDAEDYLYDHY